MNKRRKLVVALSAGVITVPLAAIAQYPKKIPRIAFFGGGSVASYKLNLDAFKQGLRELGYVEGKTIVIEYRFAEGKDDRLAALAIDLVRSKPDVIVTAGTVPVRVLKDATNTVPIVVASAGNLVERGIVTSLARPGGNVTGLTSLSPDLSGKRLEILKKIMPQTVRVGVLYRSHEEDELKETETAARILGIQIQPHLVQEQTQFANIYATMSKEKASALLIFRNPFTSEHRKQILELAIKFRQLTMCEGIEWVNDGCLASYAASRIDSYRRAATFVDKILKGRKPADLPVEQPTKIELHINGKTVRALGLTIPESLLNMADAVIE